jgi:UDP-4-amino-4,6-dideoxy-N-acetyl-beta-L-altrosamine N-acetyltransferase
MSILNSVCLKEITEHDLPLVLSWRNQDNIKNVSINNETISLSDHLKWYNSVKDNDDIKVFLFFINETPLGVMNIRVDRQNEKCEWGFYIGAKNAPKGAGTIMAYEALNYIFNQLRLRKVCAEVLEQNMKSFSFHKKLGFSIEGKLIKHLKKNDQFIDVYLLGLFKEQWDKVKEQINLSIERIEK